MWTSMREFWTVGVFFLSPLPHQLPPIPSMTCCHDALDFWWKLKQTQKSDSSFSSVGLFFLLWSFFPILSVDRYYQARALYPLVSMVNHSCIPNVRHTNLLRKVSSWRCFLSRQHHRSQLDGFDRLQRPVRKRERWWWWSWKRQDQHSKFNH